MAPVLLRGLAVGALLDRFDRRAVLIVDSLFRAAAVTTIPISAATVGVPQWLPFAVAAVYGLLKMVPLAGFPAAIPALVDEKDLDSAAFLSSPSPRPWCADHCAPDASPLRRAPPSAAVAEPRSGDRGDHARLHGVQRRRRHAAGRRAVNGKACVD
jgi:hypothetical protein